MNNKGIDKSFDFVVKNNIKKGDLLLLKDGTLLSVNYIHPYYGLISVYKYPLYSNECNIANILTNEEISIVVDVLK